MHIGQANLGDVKNAWNATKRTLSKSTSEKEMETLRVMFYMGALTVHSIINKAARLPDPYPQTVLNAMDKEIAEFEAEMHQIAQRAQDAARAKEIAGE